MIQTWWVKILFGYVVFGGGAISLWMGIDGIMRGIYLSKEPTRTGKIIDFEGQRRVGKTIRYYQKGSNGCFDFYPIIEYATTAGEKRRFTAKDKIGNACVDEKTTPFAQHIEKQVNILYNHKHPEDVATSWEGEVADGIAAILVSGLLFFFGVWVLKERTPQNKTPS